MSEHIEKLITKVNRLERETERLQMIEGVGVWTDWTPTISYAGGTTDPTSATVTSARYLRLGKLVIVYAQIAITRGSGDRTITTLSYPVTRANIYSTGVGDQNVTIAGHNIVPVYMANVIAVLHGTMTRDGTITLQLTYEAA